MGRMHSDAQFAGSSSVPAHVEMMGFLGIGNNPMVGCTVACAVDVATAVNGNQKCSDFGNSECSIFGIKTTVLLASAVQ